MAQIGISITKRVSFRDSTQEFSNVYHYASVDPRPSEADAEGFIDELVAFEKQIHATNVSFVRAKCWESGGTAASNRMIFQKNLTGMGAAVNGSYDKERAFLIQWNAGVDNRGRPVRLKKWFHTCGAFGTAATVPTTGVLDNSTGMTQAQRDAIAAKADEVTRIGNLEAWGLVGPSGRERDGGPPICHKYLEHHQLGDQWRS